MSEEYQSSLELLETALSHQLYEKLVIQLAKDFSLANIPFDLPHSIAPEELKTLLHEKVYVLLLERFSEYLNLMYIVDVPEKAFSTIESSDIVTVSEQVSFLILRREWQKVWLKDKYGSH